MVVKQLKPIIDKLKYSNSITRVLNEFFIYTFWAEIARILKPVGELENAKEDVVIEAIRSGRIEYVNGKFYGKFNSKISKALIDMGAKYNKVTKTFDIAKDLLPINVIEAIAASAVLTATVRKQLLDFLNSFNIENYMPDLQKVLDVPLDHILEDLDEQAYFTLKDAITIEPELSPEMKTNLKKEYTENMELSIKNFTEKQIIELRQIIEENQFKRNSNESLIKQIQDRYGVTESKARFLARQETSLLTAKYRKLRYTDVGVYKVKWSTSHDNRVRDSHKKLDGQIFDLRETPPIIDERTGQRGWPGEAYGCRCVLIGIIE